ncbi:hypothetical protein FSP39_006627 [Pinctada imbricata]|uniref:C2H2-type domain-containing protein n=1 Tax=Pinctada imbricata TaxID=66713 RepID=A0AA89BPK9_PINIB|nr:hypothetical protein FSP39_006627 [Pinctada imbricata]
MECKICNIDFFSHKQALIHHIRSVHGILLFGNVPSRKALICKICNQTFMNEAYLREHINGKHFGTRYSCTCGKTFKWRSSFSGHKRKCNGVITSTVNSRGRGKPLSIPRKRFDADCTDSTYRMTWKQQKTQHSPRTEQSSNERSKGLNSVPGIETLLANVRKERMMETLPSAPIANTNIQSIGTPQGQQIQNKRTASNSVRDPNSLRISPKVKSFMEPIVQKATKDNLSRTTDTARQANSNISLSAPERNMGKERQMTTVHSNRKTDNITVTNPTRISVKQEKDQMNTLPSGLSNIKTEKNENQESGQVSVNRDTQSSDKLAMQNAYPVSPYMLYPNLFNFHPQNFLQEELQGSKSNTQKAPLLTKENDFSNVPQTNPFENHLMSVNSLVPFFANALNTLQQSIIPNAANPSLPAKSPRTEKTRPATSSSVSSTFSASMNKTAQAGADFGCNSCKKRFASRRELENHPCKLYCEICKINFKCKASAREHMLGKHGGENRYSCPCGLRFKWRSSLGCHQRNCPKAPPKKIKILQ